MSPRRARSTRKPLRDSYELSDEEAWDQSGLGMGFAIHPANLDVYKPHDNERIPPAGAWIIIKRHLPALEGGIDEHVRPGRCFWAERDGSADPHGFTQNGTYKVWLRGLPWGDCALWPYEYATIPTAEILGAWQDGSLVFNPLRIDLARLNEITFYARSRGIGLAAAAVMALGSVEGAVGYFEPAPALAEETEQLVHMLSSIGGPLTEVNHQRRAAARKRREARK